ncbi:MAG: hypothetical protein ACJAVV_002901 [Alphaproteobacteria bacterium]|jgi:hypothetical protein
MQFDVAQRWMLESTNYDLPMVVAAYNSGTLKKSTTRPPNPGGMNLSKSSQSFILMKFLRF